ncbi:MAG: V-type ATP synthase subunit D [Chloroflexota bacterium]|nr:V-type ATP synthase subunit D [Chloroflexota bacterium]
MPRERVAPTRSNLLSLRETCTLAQEGYDILDKKREVLTTHLMRMAHQAVEKQKHVWQLLDEAYRELERARLSMGRERLEWVSLAVNATVEVEVTPRSVMGVVIPSVAAHGAPPEIPYGLGDTTVALDEAVVRFRRVLLEIPQLSELTTAVWRLSKELQKTQRRVNALEYIFIPRYRDDINRIESALEEREREGIFRLKLLKSQVEKKAGVGPEEHEYGQPYRDVRAGPVNIL